MLLIGFKLFRFCRRLPYTAITLPKRLSIVDEERKERLQMSLDFFARLLIATRDLGKVTECGHFGGREKLTIDFIAFQCRKHRDYRNV